MHYAQHSLLPCCNALATLCHSGPMQHASLCCCIPLCCCCCCTVQIQDDHDLNQLVHLTAADTMELEAALQVQQQTVLQLLSMQLLPCATQAADAARSAVGQQQHEIGVVEKLPVLELSEPARVLHSHEAATQGGEDSRQQFSCTRLQGVSAYA